MLRIVTTVLSRRVIAALDELLEPESTSTAVGR
jgi:hypothetical protein